MTTLKKNKSYSFFLTKFVVLYFFSQFVFKVLQYNNFSFYRTTIFLNFIFEIVLLIFYFKLNNKRFHLLILFLIACFIVGQLSLNTSTFLNFESSTFLQELTTGHLLQLNNYLFIFPFWEVFRSCENRKQISLQILKTLNVVFLINSIFVLSGIALGTDFLKSYPFTERFGFIGLLNAHTFATYFYFIIIIHYYREWITQHSSPYKLIYAILIALLLGKKAVLLFCFLLFAYHLHYIVKINRKVLIITFSSCLVSIFVFRNFIMQQLINALPFWKKIYEEDGILSVLTSQRSEKLIKVANEIDNNWRMLNYFTGGPVLPNYRVEYGIVDLYIYLGFFGITIFYYFFYDLFRDLKYKDCVLVSLILIVSFFVGGFLVNINLMIFYTFLIATFAHNKKHH